MALKLGTDILNKDEFLLPTEQRMQNTVVYGAIGSGKTRSMLLSMAVEQLGDTSSGATFICGRGNESWLLDRMANKMNRDVIFLHPLSDKGTADYIELEYTTGAETQKFLIDYIDAIKKKKIVIVDFHLSKTRKKGRIALVKLLYQLQRSITHNSDNSPHYVYIDDAEFTLPYIEELLKYGKESAVGTTLFLSSYKLVDSKSKELAYFLDANAATVITMNRLIHSDMVYFDNRFYGDMKNSRFRRRAKDEVVIETIIDDCVEVRNVLIKIPSMSLITELEDEVKKEKEERSVRRRPRKRGILQSIKQEDVSVESGFSRPAPTKRIFLDEDDFFNNL